MASAQRAAGKRPPPEEVDDESDGADDDEGAMSEGDMSEGDMSEADFEAGARRGAGDPELLSANLARTVDRYRSLLSDEQRGALDAEAEAEAAAESDDDDDNITEPIREVETKKGVIRFQVKLVEEAGTFKTLEQASEFMLGERYKKALKRELVAIRLAKKGLMSPEAVAKRERQRDAAHLKKHEAAKAKKKAKVLSPAQIEQRKEKFQRKKQRRTERKADAAQDA
ncbi:hypothetical protein M885DRAFT_621207 [Pelagophyceae sp. CCMP2097]|nr:hypothetical protein M885DRAFT_621207 [Pelagophyceae sp. CCMP2097]